MFEIFKYYGFDWLALIFGVIGLWQIGNKNRSGFVFFMISAITGFIFAVLADSIAYMVINVVAFFIQLRGYIKWGSE